MTRTNSQEKPAVKTDDAPRLAIDWDLYADYLDDADLSGEQKREFIETLWYIVLSFVDLGFGVDSVSHAVENRPSVSEPRAQGLSPEKDSPLQARFNGANDHPRKKERIRKGRTA